MAAFENVVSSVIFTALLCCCAKATYDVNIKEFQMVADHLSPLECRKLLEALNETHFYLEHKMTGKKAPHRPCIDLLLTWNENEGEDKMSVGEHKSTFDKQQPKTTIDASFRILSLRSQQMYNVQHTAHTTNVKPTMRAKY